MMVNKSNAITCDFQASNSLIFRSLENTPLKPKRHIDFRPQQGYNLIRKRSKSLELDSIQLHFQDTCKFDTHVDISILKNTSLTDLLTPTKPSRHCEFSIPPISSPLIQSSDSPISSSMPTNFPSSYSSYWHAIDNDVLSLVESQASIDAGYSSQNVADSDTFTQSSLEHNELLSYWNIAPKCDYNVGFSTARGSRIAGPSCDALEKAKSILDISDKPSMAGFSTANGKSCQLSESSILKAKEMFNQEDIDTESGFCFANGRSIPAPSISTTKKSLNISKDDTMKKASKSSLNPLTIQIIDYKRPLWLRSTKNSDKIFTLIEWFRMYKKNPLEILSIPIVLTDDMAEKFQLELFSNKKPTISWIKLQYKFIAWKIRSYSRWFTRIPNIYDDCIDYLNIIKGRIQERWEIDGHMNDRSILRQIVEQDQSSMLWMVLFVSRIAQFKINDQSIVVIYLSDGWYEIMSILDNCLLNQLYNGRIFIGQKLNVCNAKLEIQNEQSMHEVVDQSDDSNDKPIFKLCFNSVKRARWYEKLGRKKGFAFATSLDSLHQDGGIIPCIRVTICSPMLPMCYMDRTTMATVNVNMHINQPLYEEDHFTVDDSEDEKSDQQSGVMSAFISFVVTDGCPDLFRESKKIHNRIAVIRMWNPAEDLMEQVDRISSGAVCMFSRLKPFRMQQWTRDIIWLESTKMTQIAVVSCPSKLKKRITIDPISWTNLSQVKGPFVTINSIMIDIVSTYETIHPFTSTMTQRYESIFIASTPGEPLGVVSIRICLPKRKRNKNYHSILSKWHSIQPGSTIMIYNLTFNGRDPRYGYYLFYENDYTYYTLESKNCDYQSNLAEWKRQVRNRAMGEI